MRRTTAIFLLVVLVALAHVAIVAPRLPETVPTHFGGGGQPDAWSSKGAAIGMHLVILFFTVAMFGGLARWLPRIPNALINLPHKDHWLDGERREESLRVLSDYLLTFGAATVFFLMGVMHLTFQVALGHQETLGSWFWVLLVGYLALAFGSIPWLLERFPRPPESTSGRS